MSTTSTRASETKRATSQGRRAHATRPDLVAFEVAAPTLRRSVIDYANFDHGASTPAFAAVVQAVETVTRTYASVHRGAGHASRVTTAYYEAAREEVGAFLGARAGDEVVFTRNTTDAFNLLARALPPSTTVIVFATEHHATLLPWDAAHSVRLPVPGSVRDAEVLLEDALSAVGTRNVLVVLTGASNVTGELWPVRRLADLTHAHGARVAVDAAQLAPHRRVDLDALGADYVAFSGHKVYAPFGSGVLAGRRDWLDVAEPYLAGGGATASVTPTHTRWQTGPARHEAGSPNVVGAVALAAACATIRQHRAAIEDREADLAERLLDGLRAIDGVRTYSIFGPDHERLPVVTFTVEGYDSALVSAALSAEYAIGVRDGRFCAHILVDTLLEEDDVAPSGGTAIRVSAGLANTDEHVDRLLAAVARIAAQGPDGHYEHVAGSGWRPVDDPRDLTVPLPW
jgi:selenocysteine lyase/cysteine desulfurase